MTEQEFRNWMRQLDASGNEIDQWVELINKSTFTFAQVRDLIRKDYSYLAIRSILRNNKI